jgi:hypothetical protein
MFYVHGFVFGKFHLLIIIIFYKNTIQPVKLRSHFRRCVLDSAVAKLVILFMNYAFF